MNKFLIFLLIILGIGIIVGGFILSKKLSYEAKSMTVLLIVLFVVFVGLIRLHKLIEWLINKQ